MIPCKITLHNFISYGPQNESLDFHNFDLACLSGPNGAGKSSLLEAILWVLWGKGRASDDELIHQVEKEMWVDFEFSIEGVKYRVVRKRIKKRQSSLELFLEKNGVFFPISEATYTKTQEKLSKILKISQEAFLNSAFLRQGKADEFTKKTPAERKAILGEILGLDFYENLLIKAKEKIKEKENFLSAEKVLIEKMKEEVEREPQYQKELKKTEINLKNLKEKIQEEEQVFFFWNRKAILVEQKEEEKENLTKDKEILLSEAEENQREKEFLEEEIKKFAEIRSQQKEIKDNFETLEKLKKEEKILAEKLSSFSQLNQKKHQLIQEIEKEKHNLKIQQNTILASLASLKERIQKIGDLKIQRKIIKKELESKKVIEEGIKKCEEEKRELEKEEATIKATLLQIKKEGEALSEKMALILKTTAHCPLCEKPLEGGEKKRLYSKFQKELEEIRKEYTQNLETIKEIQKKKEELKKNIQRFSEEKEKISLKEKKLFLLYSQIKEAEEAEKEKKKLEEKLPSFQMKIKNKTYAPEFFKKLKNVDAEIKKLAYSSDFHNEIKKKIGRLSHFSDLKKKLNEAEFKIEKDKEKILKLQSLLLRINEKISQLEKKIKKVDLILKDKEKIITQKEERQKSLAGLRETEKIHLSKQAFFETKLKEIKTHRKELAEREKKILKLEEEKSIYKKIVEIVGKNGIPAMIIKRALPQIEEEAQRLLYQLTEGRLKVFLKTEREKKTKGEIAETLDIIVADEKGEREYSMFSGGEAFRIDFALRIALSKFLAQQANFNLQIVVIDEGFGTQDSQGLEYLVEAINTIKNYFKKIIIITHLEEFKYQFPTKINIIKDQEGSHISVEG